MTTTENIAYVVIWIPSNDTIERLSVVGCFATKEQALKHVAGKQNDDDEGDEMTFAIRPVHGHALSHRLLDPNTGCLVNHVGVCYEHATRHNCPHKPAGGFCVTHGAHC